MSDKEIGEFGITHKYDNDSGLVEFFVNGEEVCCWCCDDEEGLELSVDAFNKIFSLGAKQANQRIASQQREIDELKNKNESLRMLFIDFKATMRTVKNTSDSMLDQASEFEKLLGDNNG
jgi:FtsZ-binding cell division protein ZapB